MQNFSRISNSLRLLKQLLLLAVLVPFLSVNGVAYDDIEAVPGEFKKPP